MKTIIIEIIIVVAVFLPIWSICASSKLRDSIIARILSDRWDEKKRDEG